MITRDNYEIYIIDFQDGNLSHEDQTELFLFLDRNPDLKQEFESFEEIKLESETFEFGHKNLLFHIPETSFFDITDIEYLSIAKLENEISAEEEKILSRKLQNETYSKIYASILKTKLIADASIIYENKNNLKKLYISNRIKRIAISGFSIAASILILISFTNILWKKEQTLQITEVKHKNTVSNSIPENISEIISEQKTTDTKEKIKTKEIIQQKKKLGFPNKNIAAKTRGCLIEIQIDTVDNSKIEETEYLEIINPIAIEFELEEPKICAINSDFINPEIKQTGDLDYKRRLWKAAETGIVIFSKMTDGSLTMQNTYGVQGSISELNISVKNISFSKTFK